MMRSDSRLTAEFRSSSAPAKFPTFARHFLGPELLLVGIVQANGSVRFRWSLEDLEEVLGYVANSANHTKDRKLEKRLHQISDKLAAIIDRL